jgi:5'-phosphate synthase pdxT subunit
LPEDLDGLSGLVIPGGESTSISMQMESSGLTGPLRAAIGDGLPVLGTCAGMIMLSRRIHDGRPDQVAMGAIDIEVLRNGYGRQRASFETDLEIVLDGSAPQRVHGVFIRAPKVVGVGAGVEILASHDGDPVLVRSGPIIAAAFHPELTDDDTVHRLLVEAADAYDMRRQTNDLEEG